MLSFLRHRIARFARISEQHERAVDNLVDNLAIRVQRIESELWGPKLDRLFRELHAGIEAAVSHGCASAAALQAGLRASVGPMRRGRPGGLARARSGWRHADGTFMGQSEIDAILLEDYERHAAGGRARARNAPRYPDGTFGPLNQGEKTLPGASGAVLESDPVAIEPANERGVHPMSGPRGL